MERGSRRRVSPPFPRDVAHELSCKVRYPNRIETSAGLIRFRRSRWEHWNEGENEPAIRHREAVFWLHASDGERVAMLKLSEYDLDCGVYWEEFWTWTDGLEAQAGHIVEAMQEALSDGPFVSVSDWGPLVFATSAWIAPAWRTRLDMGALFDAALNALSPKYAAAFLLAFPEPYDDEIQGPDTPVEELGGFDWRQRALVRLYERALGFQQLQTKEASEFVMWRPRPDLRDTIVRALQLS